MIDPTQQQEAYRAEARGARMRALRLHSPGIDGLTVDEVAIPTLGPGEALVRAHAAAITRDELEWPVDRLPAIPSYEVSGVVAEVAPDVTDVAVGDAVYALTAFDRDGGAAEYVAVSAAQLAAKPKALSHVESSTIPLAGLSAWQGLVDHGHLEAGQRVLILGAAGGVGYLATQIAHARRAHVVGAASGDGVARVRELGADEAVDTTAPFDEMVGRVDLVFDTVGGEAVARSAEVVREGGAIVSVAEEPQGIAAPSITTAYFVVEQSRAQLRELTALVDEGWLRPAVDSVFALADARSAFERVQARGKRGKVVLEIYSD